MGCAIRREMRLASGGRRNEEAARVDCAAACIAAGDQREMAALHGPEIAAVTREIASAFLSAREWPFVRRMAAYPLPPLAAGKEEEYRSGCAVSSSSTT
ncbi:hypothetical protein MRX96_008249 [Rhipicephalus microplus]